MSRILIAVFSSLRQGIYLHASNDVKFYIATFQKKNMIHKTFFFWRHESPCLPLKIFKLLNKREERTNNAGKTVVIFPHIFHEMLGVLVRLVGTTKA